MATPRLIALCGNPTSGKSTAAKLIGLNYGHQLVDDGLPLRQIGMSYLGLSEHQVFTQGGKLETVELNGRDWTVREILGEIGNAFEEKFGGDIIPIMSEQLLDPAGLYTFGSVRREQGLFWRNRGALVLEIVNPTALPSPYEFDRYNRDYVHARILNDGLARGLSPEEASEDLAWKLIAEIDAFGGVR